MSTRKTDEQGRQWTLASSSNRMSRVADAISGTDYLKSGERVRVIEYSAHKAALDRLDEAEKLIGQLEKMINGDCNSPKELCALMAEGEGNDVNLYQDLAKASMLKLDEALELIEKWKGEK